MIDRKEQTLAPEAIRRQLARILESPAFDASERLKEFLNFVVEETLGDRGDTLKGQTIATTVFRRGEDFDSSHDAIVRVEARKLRKALENYYLRDGADDPIRIQIPKGAYVPVFRRHTPTTHALHSGEGEPRIVVMPFELLSEEAGQIYLAAGLTEEITTALSRYKKLQVVAGDSARHLQQQSLSALEVGRELGARFLLEGNVRGNDTTIKVAVKLTDGASGILLWSEQYRRQLTIENIFELQEEIARTVAGKIGGAFGIVANQIFIETRAKTPPSLTAYEALLRCYNYNISPSLDSFHTTLDIVNAALEQEPEYGNLWAALAFLYAENYMLEFCPAEAFPLEDAETYARRGVELDPGNQSTHMSLAHIFLIRNNLDGYAEEGDYAYRLNPNNAYYVGVYGYCELLAGHWERGLSLVQESIRLNPYHPSFYFIALFLHAYAHHDYHKAYKEAMKYDLPICISPLYQAAALGQLGRKEEANAKLETLLQLHPNFPTHAQEFTGRLIKAEGQVEHIVEGLQKVGLRLEG